MARRGDGEADIGLPADQLLGVFVDAAEFNGECQFRPVLDELCDDPRQDPVPDGWRGDNMKPTDRAAAQLVEDRKSVV